MVRKEIREEDELRASAEVGVKVGVPADLAVAVLLTRPNSENLALAVAVLLARPNTDKKVSFEVH